MPHIIMFETSMFDARNEPENPINPIAGYSPLAWLRSTLASRIDLTEPDSEDWGWYSTGTLGGYEYLVGCSSDDLDAEPPLQWLIQVHKERPVGGKGVTAEGESLADVIVATLRA